MMDLTWPEGLTQFMALMVLFMALPMVAIRSPKKAPNPFSPQK